MKDLTLKLGEAMLKSYSVDEENIKGLDGYFSGEIDGKVFLERIGREKYRGYIFDFKKVVREVCNEEEIILVRFLKLVESFLGSDGKREVVKKVLENGGQGVATLLKEKIVSIEEIIGIVSREIISINTREKMSLALCGFVRGVYSAREILDFLNLEEELITVKRKLKLEKEKNFITLYIELLCSLKSERDIEKLILKMPSYCSEVYKESKDCKREFKGFTDILLIIIELKEDFSEEEKEILREGLRINKINRLSNILSEKERVEESLKLLRKIDINEDIISISLIKSFNPLEWGNLELLNRIKNLGDFESLLKISEELGEDYVSLFIKGIMGRDINDEASIYIGKELEKEEIFKESLLNIKKKELTPYLLNEIEYLKGNLIYSKGLALLGVFKNPPEIFKEILSISYRANYSSLVSKLVKVIKNYRDDLKNSKEIFDEILSFGIPLKVILKMHLIYLRYEEDEDEISYLLSTYYKEGIECYIEDGLHNWGEIKRDLERYVGDKILESAIYILNTGNVQAIKFIVEKLRGKKEYLKEIKSFGNLEDLQSRKAIVDILISFNGDDEEKFLRDIYKGETSKCIRDKIDKFLLEREEEKIKDSKDIKKITTYIKSKVKNRKIQGDEYIKEAPKVKWKNGGECSDEIVRYIFLSYGGGKEIQKNEGIRFLTSKISKKELEELGDFLFSKWKENGALAKERWVLSFLSDNISEKSILKVYKLILELTENNRNIVAIDCIRCLFLSEKISSLKYLRILLSSAKNKRIREEIEKGFLREAENRKLSLDEVYDLAIPTERLIRGKKYILGKVEYKMVVSKGKIRLIDSEMKLYKQFPLGKDEDKIKKLNESLRKFKLTIRKVVNDERDRIEDEYKRETIWKFEDFKNIYLNNSILYEAINKFEFKIYNNEGFEKEYDVDSYLKENKMYDNCNVKIIKIK